MLKKSHIAIGVAATIPLVLNSEINIIYGAVGVLASTLPDIDKKIGIPHRGFSHSLIATGLVYLSLCWFIKPLAFALAYNYLIHIIADSFTRQGVPILWPLHRNFGLKLFKVTNKSDMVVFSITLLIIAYELLNFI